MVSALLIVEDSDEDFEAIVRAFRSVAADAVRLKRAANGDEALDVLENSGAPPLEPLPKVVLLDLNLPGTDGREVLEELKSTKRLRELPVVIVSASSNPRTIAECYRAGASGYMVKPMDFTRLEELVRAIKTYWIDTVELPSEDAQP